MFCLTVDAAHGVTPGTALDRSHGRPPSNPADLAALPILPHKLPACVVHAAARADLRLSEVTRYLDLHTWANFGNKAILSTWMEQPPESGSPEVTNDALQLAVRPEGPYQDNEERLFSFDRLPLRPRLQVLILRRDIGIGPESLAQRKNMTDEVPHIVYATDIDQVAVLLGDTAATTQPCTAFSSESAHRRFYLNESWTLARHIELDEYPVPHLFLRENALGLEGTDFSIVGTTLIWIHRVGAAPVQVRTSVFRPRTEVCVTLILSARMLPRIETPIARTKNTTSIFKPDGRSTPTSITSRLGLGTGQPKSGQRETEAAPQRRHPHKRTKADGAPWVRKGPRQTFWQHLRGQTVVLLRFVSTRLTIAWTTPVPAMWKPGKIRQTPCQQTPVGKHTTSTHSQASRRGKPPGTHGIHKTVPSGGSGTNPKDPRGDNLTTPSSTSTSSLQDPWAFTFKLEASMTNLSCVNETCSHLVELMTRQTSDQLGLPGLDHGCSWATLSVPTSPSRSWSIALLLFALGALLP